MKAKFDFNKINKKMPYTVPNDFFIKMEEDIWKEVKEVSNKKSKSRFLYLNITIKALSTIAAAVALFIILDNTFTESKAIEISDVEQAFCNLSHEDQSYIISIYNDDVFINE